MKKDLYYIGMDGGGTKTAAVIISAEGNILAEHVSGPSNFQIIGVEKAAKIILELVRECCSSVQCTTTAVAGVTVGLTGAGRPVDQERMAKGVLAAARAAGMKLRGLAVESDARIALEGAFKGGAGIILIAGTGSIAFVGGWGRILGDEGSGYFIGRSGLTAVTRHLDGRSTPTLLTKMMAREFGLKTQADIIAAVYRNNFDVAAVAPLVLKAAGKSDEVCMAIVAQAVWELGEHIRAMSMLLQPSVLTSIKRKIPIAFIGGLIANPTLLSDLLGRHTREEIRSVQRIEPMAPPMYGAALMALSFYHKH
jgi:N-acetylglucosamine kinase-like BadF-type ATPase